MIFRNGYDRRKNPTTFEARTMTRTEARALRPGQRVLCQRDLARNGQAAPAQLCTVTSVQTWKTRDDVVVKTKFGLKGFEQYPNEGELVPYLLVGESGEYPR
jgi:hypothetical protein